MQYAVVRPRIPGSPLSIWDAWTHDREILTVAVFRYKVSIADREDFQESGYVVAPDEGEANRKLRNLGFDAIRLRKLTGFAAFIKQFTADVK